MRSQPASSRTLPPRPRSVLSSLNDMIDITTTRLVAIETHPPQVIYYGLALLVIASSMLAGYGAPATTRSWMHMLVYAVILSSSLYVILDISTRASA